MDPVIGNSIMNTCPDPVSSNCVTWAGGSIDGVCQGSSITQVIQQVNNKANSAVGCCTGVFPPGNVSGYTGNWVNFQPSIPLTGGVPQQYSWVISDFGVPYDFVPGGPGTGIENTPQYKWTQQGDLLVRGSFLITVTPFRSAAITIAPIPLVSIPVTNMPTGFTAAQTIPVSSTFSVGSPAAPYLTIITRGALTLDYPSGILYLNFSYISTQINTLTDGIFMGGIKFNLA